MKIIILCIILFFICSFSLVWLNLDRFIFKPTYDITFYPDFIDVSFHDLFYRHNNYLINFWYMKSPTAKKIILFSHGNYGNLSHRLPFIDFWKQYLSKNYSLIIYDYVGFGKSKLLSPSDSENNKHKTIPTIKTAKESLKIMISYLNNNIGFDNDSIILYGSSLGGAITASVTAELLQENPSITKFYKVILQSTFTSLNDQMSHLVTILSPVIRFMPEYFPVEKNLQILKKLGQYTFIMHSQTDELIPFKMFLQNKKFTSDNLIISGTHSNPKLNLQIACSLF